MEKQFIDIFLDMLSILEAENKDEIENVDYYYFNIRITNELNISYITIENNNETIGHPFNIKVENIEEFIYSLDNDKRIKILSKKEIDDDVVYKIQLKEEK